MKKRFYARTGGRTAVIGILCCLLAAILPFPAPGEPQEDRKNGPVLLVVAVNGFPRGLNDLPVLYAQKKGLFGKHGLDAEIRVVSGGQNMIAALLNGEAHICQNRAAGIVSAVAEGGDLAVVAISMPQLPMYLVVRQETVKPSDLAGQKVVLTNEFGMAEMRRLFLKPLGLEEKDVTVLTIRNTFDRLAALESGAVAGILLPPPAAMIAMEKGYPVLFDYIEKGISMPVTAGCTVTTRKFLEESPEGVDAFLRAVSEATWMMKQDREGSIALMAEHFSLDPSANRAALEANYRLAILDGLPVNPAFRPGLMSEVIRSVSEGNPKAARLTPEAVCETGPLQRLDAEGFFQKLGPLAETSKEKD